MNEFFADPDYPDRPNHPDFARLIGAIAALDGAAGEPGVSAEDVAATRIDLESLTYMAQQRTLRMTRSGQHRNVPPEVVWASFFVDGFLAGQQFQIDGGHTTTSP